MGEQCCTGGGPGRGGGLRHVGGAPRPRQGEQVRRGSGDKWCAVGPHPAGNLSLPRRSGRLRNGCDRGAKTLERQVQVVVLERGRRRVGVCFLFFSGGGGQRGTGARQDTERAGTEQRGATGERARRRGAGGGGKGGRVARHGRHAAAGEKEQEQGPGPGQPRGWAALRQSGRCEQTPPGRRWWCCSSC